MVARLCEGMASRGHQVELFASGDSNVSVPIRSVVARATLFDEGSTTYLEKEYEARNCWNLYRQADRFDLIHAHWPTLAPYFSDRTEVPTVLSYHYIEPDLHRAYRERFPRIQPVCVSRRQRDLLGDPDLPVVYNGLRVEEIPFRGEPGEGMIFVGRIVPNKGVAEAIRMARELGEKLLIVGDITPYLPWSGAYWREMVEPHVDGDRVRHIRHLPNRQLHQELSLARAFLFPLQWEEPFGLAPLEAMATGTPVLTLARGAMPEVVEDGVTGFVCDTDDELLEAAGRVGELDREACRRRVQALFSEQRMLDGYEEIYRRVVAS
jgi:glycosyltransferase involved in cell wall biosynthesis